MTAGFGFLKEANLSVQCIMAKHRKELTVLEVSFKKNTA